MVSSNFATSRTPERYKCSAFAVTAAHYAQNGSILRVSIQRITWRMNSCTCYIPAAAARTSTRGAATATATSVSFILKLFKLVTQSNTYNFTIMAIVAVWLRSQLFHVAHFICLLTDAGRCVTPACQPFFRRRGRLDFFGGARAHTEFLVGLWLRWKINTKRNAMI